VLSLAQKTAQQKRNANANAKANAKARSKGWPWLLLGGVGLALLIWGITAAVNRPLPVSTPAPNPTLTPLLTTEQPTATGLSVPTLAPSATIEVVVTEFPTPDPAVLVTADPSWPYPEIARVNLEGARAALEAGNAVLVDTRSAASFAQSHAVGAINLPVNEMEALYTQLDPDQWIIPYCT